MRLSKFYSDRPEVFAPVRFDDGLNVVFAEIRLPENRKKDTHNLGKTTLGSLLNFGFLAGRDKDFFLFKHFDLFRRFTFLLEIELGDASFLTVRRRVGEHSKIAFLRHDNRHQDYSKLPNSRWDHVNVPIEAARQLLDSILNLSDIKPWDYRKGLGYLLRSQDDYQDVFQLGKFRYSHAQWKPYLAHILGFNYKPIERNYEVAQSLDECNAKIEVVRQELGGTLEDASVIDGLLLLKSEEAVAKQKMLDDFDFRTPDLSYSKHIVEDVDEQIATLNSRRYLLQHNRKKIMTSLQQDQILFQPAEAARLFKEVGVLFDGQIKKDFEQLVAFNRAITEERNGICQAI